MRLVDAALGIDLIGTAALAIVSAARPALVARRTAVIAGATVAMAAVGLRGMAGLVVSGAVVNAVGTGLVTLRLHGARQRSAVVVLVAGSALSAVYLVGIRSGRRSSAHRSA